MKIRNSFVSNSSSSSFLIAIKEPKEERCKCCGRKNEDILHLIDTSVSHYDSEVVEIGEDNILEYVKDNYYDDVFEKYKILLNEFNKKYTNYKIALISIDYNDEYIKQELDVGVEFGHIKILEGHNE